MADSKEVRVPDIGDFTDVEIIDVLVKEGDVVAAEDPLITLETDKASMDVPSPVAGKVAGLAVQKGGRVSEGDVIVTLEVEGGEAADAPAAEPASGAAGAAVEVPERESAPAREPEPTAPDPGRASPQASGRREVAVPDIGDFEAVEIIEVHVQVGDTIAEEDPLITLESDKASMDVPSPAAGRIAELKVGKGDRVSQGDVVAILESDAAGPEPAAPAATAESPARRPKEAQAPPADTAREPKRSAAPEATVAGAALPAVGEFGFANAHAGPSVRRLARELGVDLSRVQGSGVKGRITHEDVKAWVKAALDGARPAAAVGGTLPAVPDVDFSKFGATELKPLSRVQRIAGPRLHASWVNLPHVTQFDEADITDMEDTRKGLKDEAGKEGVRLTPLAFILRACVKALMEFPQFNASLHSDGQQLVMKRYYNIGFAVDTPGGLVVPVIKDLEGKTLLRVARELGELSEKARTGKLAAADMQGGNFTVSSLGSIGGTYFTPIINAPEVAILGVSRAYLKPVWEKKKFVPRLMLPLSLSYDHRVIDGALAVRFTRFLADILADVERLLA